MTRLRHCILLSYLNELAKSEPPFPRLSVNEALQLAGEPRNEMLATYNMAMNVWRDVQDHNELVVALVHQWNDVGRQADDQQFGVVWESNGEVLKEQGRIQMSCADVELLVPDKGPYVFEARLDPRYGSLHPECGCVLGDRNPCPRGVAYSQVHGMRMLLESPILSHFVKPVDEWQNLIPDAVTLPRLTTLTQAKVVFVKVPLVNATQNGRGIPPAYACPGSYDEPLGDISVTFSMLQNFGMVLPPGVVNGNWCVVLRGKCSETAKVKVCEQSGAVGTIIVDDEDHTEDQIARITYSRAGGEYDRFPVLFISNADGEELSRAVIDGTVWVSVGPSIGGRAPPGFQRGAGLIVHDVLSYTTNSRNSMTYEELFDTIGWLESSTLRDILFVCLPREEQIRLYDISNPLVSIRLLGSIDIACTRYGDRDYRVIDFKGPTEEFLTLFVDPSEIGNRLTYYNTQDPTEPTLELELQANWEDLESGLGQVRPAGVGGRYEIVTWRCSVLYCNNGDGKNLYVLDSWNLLDSAAVKVPLPMLTKGSSAKDVACVADGVCLVTMGWDGIVAFDSGVSGSVNTNRVVAHYRGTPFGDAQISFVRPDYKMYVGAQKVYSSKHFPRLFYVEHSDIDSQALVDKDFSQAFQKRSIYIATLSDYDPGIAVPGDPPSLAPIDAVQAVYSRTIAQNRGPSLFVFIMFIVVLALLLVACLFFFLLLAMVRRRWKANRRLLREIESAKRQQEFHLLEEGAGDNTVVGRPIARTSESEVVAGAVLHSVPTSAHDAQKPQKAKGKE